MKRNSGNWKKKLRQTSRKSILTNRIRAILTASPRLSASMWGIKELTPAIVNEFIKKIIVHAPEKVNGKRVQKVDIVFNFVGELNFLSDMQPKRQGA